MQMAEGDGFADRMYPEPVDLGIARDDLTGLQSRLAGAIAECDVVLTSGGVSMGDADPVRAVLHRLGPPGA